MPTAQFQSSALIGLGIAVVIVVVLMFILSRWRKVGPNEALIISGIGKRRGFRIVQGGGTFVWPVLEQVQRLSLEIMTLDVNVMSMSTRLKVFPLPLTVSLKSKFAATKVPLLLPQSNSWARRPNKFAKSLVRPLKVTCEPLSGR
jgi:regulator of protease activity HflC (stomatin/prohibitin superfamily)